MGSSETETVAGGRTIILDGTPEASGTNEMWLRRNEFTGPLHDDTPEIESASVDLRFKVTSGRVDDVSSYPHVLCGPLDAHDLCSSETYKKIFEETLRRDWSDAGQYTFGKRHTRGARLLLSGTDATGRQVAVRVPFKPYVFMLAGEWNIREQKIAREWTRSSAEAYMGSVANEFANAARCDQTDITVTLHEMYNAHGFDNDPRRPGMPKKHLYYKVEFPTLSARNAGVRMFKQNTARGASGYNAAGEAIPNCQRMHVRKDVRGRSACRGRNINLRRSL